MSEHSSENDEIDERGWNAISDSLEQIYGPGEPLHWGTLLPYSLGGEDPIHGISAYRSSHETHHLHYVTYGFSELWNKESEDPDMSGYGFELTFRLKCEPDLEPPNWVLSFLQNLGRYVFSTGNVFSAGDTMRLNGPICLGMDTQIQAITFLIDPELPAIETPNGHVEFLQIFGTTNDEQDAIEAWNSEQFIKVLVERNPLLVTDVTRPSYLDDSELQALVRQRTADEGSSSRYRCCKLIANRRRPTASRSAVDAMSEMSLSQQLCRTCLNTSTSTATAREPALFRCSKFLKYGR